MLECKKLIWLQGNLVNLVTKIKEYSRCISVSFLDCAVDNHTINVKSYTQTQSHRIKITCSGVCPFLLYVITTFSYNWIFIYPHNQIIRAVYIRFTTHSIHKSYTKPRETTKRLESLHLKICVEFYKWLDQLNFSMWVQANNNIFFLIFNLKLYFCCISG